MKNKIPSIRMIHSAAWNESTYDRPVMLTILATTTAKKLLSPIPGASANGLLARNAMTNIPTAEAIHVARNTPVKSNDVCHGHECCQTGKNLCLDRCVVLFEFEDFF